MQRLFAQSLCQTNWLLLAILALAVFQLSALGKTGYLGDDAGHSLIRGILQYHEVSLPAYCYRECQRWLHEMARFYPLIFPQIYGTFYLCPNLLVYKCLILGLVVVDLFLFARFIRRLTGWKGFPELSLLAVLGVFQFSVSDDPLLGYSGLLPEIFLAILLSLIWLCRYLDTGKRAWLIASSLAYLLALLTYEIAYPFFVLHVALLWSREKRWKGLLRLSLPFVTSAMVCAGISMLLRWQIGISPSSPYKVNPRWASYGFALVRQLDGALPLSHYLRSSLPDSGISLEEGIFSPIAAVFLAGFLLTVVALCRLARNETSSMGYPWPRMMGLGLALWSLPALLVCWSYEYQNRIRWGMPQISVYIEYYGVGLILASAAAWGGVRLATRRRLLVLYSSVIAFVFAGILATTHHANGQVTHHLAKGWQQERRNLEAALRAGLAEELPDHSTLILQHRYPWWHDLFIRYFYCQHAGKRLHFTWIPPGSPDRSPGRAIAIGLPDEGPFNGRVFMLLDGVSDHDSGYVLLGSCDRPAALSAGASGNATVAVRLFVHGHSKDTTCPEEALALIRRGAAMRDCSTAGLKLLRQADDWALYLWLIDRDTLSSLLQGL